MPEGQSRPNSPSPAEISMKLLRDMPLALGNTAIQAWTAMGAEAVRFASERMQHDIRTQQAMLACTSLEQLRQVQTDFFRTAAKQYAAEVERVLDQMRSAAKAGQAAVAVTRTYDDVPL